MTISGTKARRPGLDDLLRDARRGRFQVVLVWASVRIARSVRRFLEVLDELNHLEIEFVSFRENLDTGGRMRVTAVPAEVRAPSRKAASMNVLVSCG